MILKLIIFKELSLQHRLIYFNTKYIIFFTKVLTNQVFTGLLIRFQIIQMVHERVIIT